MDIRERGRRIASNLTATVTIASLGLAGIASVVVWGATVNKNSASASVSSTSNSSSNSSSDSSSSDDSSSSTGSSGQTGVVGPSTSSNTQAQSTGS